jgi:hypothetical protein
MLNLYAKKKALTLTGEKDKKRRPEKIGSYRFIENFALHT